MTTGAVQDLVELLGAEVVTTDADVLSPYLEDHLGLYRGQADAVIRPRGTTDVVSAVKWCRRHGYSVTPSGGRTGFVGGSVPSSEGRNVVLSLECLNRIREIDTVNNVLIAEAGAGLADVQAAALDAERLFPVSHGGEAGAQIGGMIASNAGGNNVVRYGMARAHVLGLEVVFANGDVWDGLRLLRKDNAGYDLKQLFIGSEGTLGIITAAALALRHAPHEVITLLAAVRDPEAALALFVRLRRVGGDLISAFELIPRSGIAVHQAYAGTMQEPFERLYDWQVLIEFENGLEGLQLVPMVEDVFSSVIGQGLSDDVVIAQSEAQRQALWGIREGLAVAQAANPNVLKSDTSVPVAAVPAFIEAATAQVGSVLPGCVPIPFGHIGDGNIHFNVMAPNAMSRADFADCRADLVAAIDEVTVRFGGSIAAEHGLGQARIAAATAARPAVEHDTMGRIKQALDPDNLLNPGKVVKR